MGGKIKCTFNLCGHKIIKIKLKILNYIEVETEIIVQKTIKDWKASAGTFNAEIQILL